MPTNQYTINPETGRQIQIRGNVFCQLIYSYYDFINNTLVRRADAPPLPPRQYFYNTITNRRILAGSRRYHEYLDMGWEIEDDYYLVPPDIISENLTTVQENPPNYERIMATYREKLTNLNITLCRECLIAMNLEEGEYCNECQNKT